MKLLFFSINLIFIVGCNSTPKSSVINLANDTVKQQIICNEDYDSSLLKYAYNFEPSTMNLSKSLSTQLDTFLLHIDTNCLRQQKEYRLFVTIILAKLYYHHLQCCNQGYDLQSMETGGAKVIIEEFKNMAGYKNQRLEMLNSGVIVDFIKSDQTLKDNSILKELLQKIDRETQRINKGNL